MRKTLLATFFLFILFSCNSSQKNTEVDNFPDVELSFMDIKIGEKSDSVIIKLNDSQKYPSIIGQEWEDSQGIWVVYEDATDYYEYLENNKTFLDAKIKEKNTEIGSNNKPCSLRTT